MQLKEKGFEIDGVLLTDIAKQFGTPLYVYHGEKVVSQVKRLQNAFDDVNIKVKYACKALTNINILKLVKSAGAGLDTVCINEIKLGLEAGFAPEEIIYTPNCVPFSEIEEAINLGVNINIDNLPFLEKIGQKYGSNMPVCLRINPHIQAGGNANIQVGHVGSKFGISYLQFDEIIDVVNKYNINVVGLHEHTGSDILDSDVFLKGAKILFKAANEFPNLKFMDFGSGFKVAYKDADHTTDIEELGQKMSSAFKEFCKSYGKELEIWFEPGKFLVSESGTFLAEATVIKQTPACTFVGINSGFNHLIRPMMYDSYHHIINLSNPDGKEKVYNIVGYICETDTFASERDLNEVKEGDLLAFKNAGAYGFEMSSNFNSRLRPAEVLIYQGKAHLIRKREDFNELMRNQVVVL